jgi:hypothetical protein
MPVSRDPDTLNGLLREALIRDADAPGERLVGLIASAVYLGKGGTRKHVGLMRVYISLVFMFVWSATLSGGSWSGY